jgi:tetratricopeptide (TPR) repeat protein
VDWTELPKHFGPDVEGLLLALTALSVSPAAQNDQDRACLVNLLRPATTKLTRLLEQPSRIIDSEQQGVFWHALGIAASLLGEYTQSQRWPEVAVHAHRTALLIWQQDTVVFQWAMVQNNLGHALRQLAAQQRDRQEQGFLLQQAIDAFQEALRVYRAAAAADFYLRQTETNLAHAEALLAERPIAAE